MIGLLRRLRRDESGPTAVEYGLIAALISVAVMAGLTLAGQALNEEFLAIGGTVDDRAASLAGGTSTAP